MGLSERFCVVIIRLWVLSFYMNLHFTCAYTKLPVEMLHFTCNMSDISQLLIYFQMKV